jgi:glucokinase
VNLGWTKVPLLAGLEDAFPWPVFLERDEGTCIHAESWFGAAQAHSNVFFRGIGLGVLAGGRHLTGARSFSGEIGHCKFVAGAEDLCTCGRKGCLEAIASGVDIARQYVGRTGTGLDQLRLAGVLERARLGDPSPWPSSREPAGQSAPRCRRRSVSSIPRTSCCP